MTRSRPLLASCIMVLVTALAACSSSEAPLAEATPASAAAPATGAPAAEASGAAGRPRAIQESSATEAKSEATLERLAQLPVQDQLPGGKWQVGKHYQPLVPAQPTSVGAGKVEVVEVFWYGCNHCYALDPFLESWKQNKPANVEFVRVPVTWGPMHLSHARFFYTLQSLKREDLHAKAFDTIHRGGNMLVANDEDSSFKVQLAWAKSNGISEKAFTEAYRGMFVSTKLRQAEELTRRYRVEGVPLMVINGKYTADVGSAGGHTQLLALLNDLSAAEKRR